MTNRIKEKEVADELLDTVMATRGRRPAEKRKRFAKKWFIYILATIGAFIVFVLVRLAFTFLGDTVSYVAASLSLFGYLYFVGNKIDKNT